MLGVNDLATMNPTLAAEWHPSKNGNLLPSQVAAGSNRKVWWCCARCGHEWAAVIASRTKGAGCPVCAGNVVAAGINDLATVNPALAAEWHPTLNGDLLPNQVTTGSARNVWWRCSSCASDFRMAVRERARQGRGCACQLVRNTSRRLAHLAEALLADPEQLTEAGRYLLVVSNGIAPGSPFGQAFITSDRAALRRLIAVDNQTDVLIPGDDLIESDVNPDGREESDTDVDSDLIAGPNDITISVAEQDDIEPDPDPIVPASTVLRQFNQPSRMLPAGPMLAYLGDAEQIEFHVTEAVSRWWREILPLDDTGDTERIAAWLADAQAQTHNPFALAVRDRFMAQYKAALALQPPHGWAFRPTPGAPITAPNLMQRHAALMVAADRQVGNWSGTGTGKTVSAVLASRVVGARTTVVFCPNNTVSGWVAAVRNCYPDSQVRSRTLTPTWGPGDGPRWLIVNYEMLPGDPAAAVALVDAEQIDFLVVDELHWLKVRAGIPASQRRQVLETIRARLRPDAYVLGLSATPVVNDLREGKSLIDLIEGVDSRLNTAMTVTNAVAMYERFCRNGFRSTVAPRVGVERVHIPVDVTAAVPDLLAGAASHMDAVIVPYFYDLIVQEAFNARARGQGVLVYTHYLRNLLAPLRERLNAQGLRVETFTGAEDKADIAALRRNKVDVLIGSAAVSTGVDGLQHWADTLIFAALPWTNAEFEQIQGRVHRQGSTAAQVRVVIPMAHIPDPVAPWNFTAARLDRITRKRTLADCVVNGSIPTSLQPSIERVQQALKDLLRRLADGRGMVASEPEPPLVAGESPQPASVSAPMWHASEFSRMGSRWSRTDSARTHERLNADPSEWHAYHAHYRAARTQWASVPADVIAARIASVTRPRRIADLGCGEMLLAARLAGTPHEVVGFDHVGLDERVVVADIANVPAPDGDFDVVVLSLALMGSNYEDYLEEAWRLLAADGTLYLAEASRRLPADQANLKAAFAARGFAVTSVTADGTFTVITATRSGAPVADRQPLFAADDLAVTA